MEFALNRLRAERADDSWTSPRPGAFFLRPGGAVDCGGGRRIHRILEVAVRVLRHAHCPVTIIRQQEGAIPRLAPFLWISLGAVFGANLRYLVNRGMAQWLGPAFPYGTFVVNTV